MIRLAAGLLLLIPLLDLMVLVVLSRHIGISATVMVVVLTALVGLMLTRFAGRRNLRRIERDLQLGEIPTDHVLDGAFILSAGILLLTPGLVTDGVALLFLIGVTRRPIRTAFKRWFLVPYLDRKTSGFVTGEVYSGFSGESPGDEQVDIEIEVEDVADDSPGESKP